MYTECLTIFTDKNIKLEDNTILGTVLNDEEKCLKLTIEVKMTEDVELVYSDQTMQL